MIIYGSRIVNETQTVVSIFDAPVTSSACHRATLMKEDFIKLSFVDDTDYKFKAGDYVTWEGQNYYLNKDYLPTMKNEKTFTYELQFNAPWYNLDSYIFFFNTYHIDEQTQEEEITKRESDWYITDTAANIIALIIRNTQDATRDCPCVFDSTFYCEGTVAKTFTFSSSSILDALNNLAKDFELEWWVEVKNGRNYLHFGECDSSIVTDENGSVIFNADGSRKKTMLPKKNLATGANVTAPSISNKKDLKKKYFVYGSSRNIDQSVDMLSQEDGTYVSSLVTKRLAMDGNPQRYIAGAVDPIITEDIGYGEEVVIFDDIYPRFDWKITYVSSFPTTSEDIEGYDEQGNPIYKTYTIYQVRLGDDNNQNAFSDYVFSLINDPQKDVQYIGDVIASGKPLSLKFIIKEENGTTVTPILSGFEFELGAVLRVNVPPDDISAIRPIPTENEDYEWYEFQIIKQDVNGYVIPNTSLKPEVGDWVCLYNIKSAYIKQQDNVAAQAELREAFKKYYKNLKKDVSYTVKPYANTSLDLNIGDSVRLNYPSGSVRSRISSFEKKLDYNIDASYTISSYVQPSTVNQLKEEVKTITANLANGRAFQLDGEAAMSILSNYGSNMFLSKTKNDTAYGKITLAKSVHVNSTNDSPASVKGPALIEGATTITGSATVSGNLGTPSYASGFTGTGWQVDGNGDLTINNLTVRQTMRVFELLIQQVKSTGGEIVVSPANGKVKSVLGYYSNRYICEIENSGESFGNTFVVNDLVRCQKWKKDGTNLKYYWVRVASVSGETIELEQIEGTWRQPNVPEVGDELVQMGNTTNTARQGAISITPTDEGGPKIAVLDGIRTPSLNNCTRVILGALNGINDPDMGSLSGYGLYSDNVFLKGAFKLGSGTEIDNAKIVLQADKTTIKNLDGDEIAIFNSDGRLIVQDVESNRLRVYSTVNRSTGAISFPSVSIGQGGESLLCYYYDNGGLMREDAQILEETQDSEGNSVTQVIGYETRFYNRDGTLSYSTQHISGAGDPIYASGGETITYTYSWTYEVFYVIETADPYTTLQQIYRATQDSNGVIVYDEQAAAQGKTSLNVGGKTLEMSICQSDDPLINEMLVKQQLSGSTGRYEGPKVFTGIMFKSNSAIQDSVAENRWSRTYVIYMGGLKQEENAIQWQEEIIQ